MQKYDYLIVGAGLFGAVFAYEATKKNKKCLVIDKRNHIGGNLYCENRAGINVHKYGAHIFHTSNKQVWQYVNNLVEFNRYTNSPIANNKGVLYNMPFNMNTFYQLWKITTPEEAYQKIAEQTEPYKNITPRNLEEQALKLVGTDIYQILIKEYTEKQWGRKATELPAFIINRLPLRFTFDNNYFNDSYQGIPIGGYNPLFEKLLEGSDVQLNTDYFHKREYFENISTQIVYTGKIDEYYNYRYGELEYRSLHFEHQQLEIENYQGNAVVNYTSREVPYTRIIEHKHFEFGQQPSTVITKEYPREWDNTSEPFYPINNQKNTELYHKYQEQGAQTPNVIFGGRLAEYKYYDMHQIIEKALEKAKNTIR